MASATRISTEIGLSLKGAYIYLEQFLADGLIGEVTHREVQRLFALKGLEPFREMVQPPLRPQPGPSRGRPGKGDTGENMVMDEMSEPTPDRSPLRLPPIDYADLDKAHSARRGRHAACYETCARVVDIVGVIHI